MLTENVVVALQTIYCIEVDFIRHIVGVFLVSGGFGCSQIITSWLIDNFVENLVKEKKIPFCHTMHWKSVGYLNVSDITMREYTIWGGEVNTFHPFKSSM